MYKLFYLENEEMPYVIGHYKSIKTMKVGAENFSARMTADINPHWIYWEETDEYPVAGLRNGL
jgi:hypothetical protein